VAVIVVVVVMLLAWRAVAGRRKLPGKCGSGTLWCGLAKDSNPLDIPTCFTLLTAAPNTYTILNLNPTSESLWCSKMLSGLRVQWRTLKTSTQAIRHKEKWYTRSYSHSPPSPFAPRHLLSIADLTPKELRILVQNAHNHKIAIKSSTGEIPYTLRSALAGKTVALTFSKRSTRTRISTEGAVVALGGHPMFLGKDDIQLGVNESLYDTSVVLSSMTSAIVARVGPHSDVADLAKHSSVPVINALSDLYHPLQIIADLLTIAEVHLSSSSESLGLEGMKIAWIGDANNVLFDLAIGAVKLGMEIAVATPKGFEIPEAMRGVIQEAALTSPTPGKLFETTVPEEAIKNADILVTDTWVSMGQEEEAAKRLAAFKGFQITSELASRGGAKENWSFMHCLPRHPEEVSDEVFYGPRSVVFREAENRLWSAIAALEGFVVNKGRIHRNLF
jgi:ornithine carbamoyltransferase